MQLMPTTGASRAVVVPTAGPAMGPLVPTAQVPADAVVDPSTVAGSATTDPAASQPGRQDSLVLDKAVSGVLAADGTARVSVDKRTNTATYLSGQFGVLSKPGVGGSGPDKLARTFLVQHGGLFGLTDQLAQLKLLTVEKDDLGYKHYKYQQMQQGLPVFGQQLVVHAQGERVTAVGGRVTPNLPDAHAKLNGTEAAQRAIAAQSHSLAGGAALTVQGAQVLGWYTLEDGTPHLAYELIVGSQEDQRWQMYVDAQTGKVLDKWTLVHSVLNRETVDSASGKVRKEGQEPTNDKVLDTAHDNAKGVYDFYKNKYDRDSIDGKGMKLKSVVHYGDKYNNAFWNGSSMTYGDGDGVRFTPFALASDVVGHEMTHGVTERTAGLRYQRQSGALNESWSDVFGNLIEKWMDTQAGKPERDSKWLIGEEIYTPGVEGDGLRSMSDPGTSTYKGKPLPAHMKDYFNIVEDSGGVHINSSIPNKAAYLVAMSIGPDKLSDVWYRALTKYMTASSQFSDAANFTVQSAIDLFGAGSAEAKAVAAAWDGVGLKPSVVPGVNG